MKLVAAAVYDSPPLAHRSNRTGMIIDDEPDACLEATRLPKRTRHPPPAHVENERLDVGTTQAVRDHSN
ncbi:TPA: hypothetical protein QDA96_005037 [Burkholderia vietnamiensis]|uniref:Uncharacterized protein n=1 Tax=Burkholderia vietnamiensis TaxID=60552 RepID=A0AAW7T0S2_BURVI|nr:hypothetical protein [Burkholderia vietnamiensis]KVS20057.1 hypothetical protein WK34_26315 [Burkholderia vietnamiensis]MBR8015397.1 hypothetical protein [Burkholderia vietnamiensis]MCA8447194.1 hypothetical protein [Burkholderia vietnamiensis]MDN7795548.1 hypothetical protein [Burkholderia vietnamiensis]HDR8955082.1 hypothetical protein [Burkholderia vietnamiensis]